MLSRDSEENVEDDIEDLGVASAQGAGESCNEVAAGKEEVKGAEEEEEEEDHVKQKGDQSPTQPEKDVQRLRENVT